MSNSLEAKLKSNLNIVFFFFTIVSIFSLIRILHLTSTNSFHLNELFTDKIYIPILIQAFGFLAVTASSLSKKIADKLSESQQVIAFTLLGTAFLPFTIILFVMGIMKLIENNQYKLHFVLSAISGLLLFGIAFSIVFI